jgi:protein SCO1/2
MSETVQEPSPAAGRRDQRVRGLRGPLVLLGVFAILGAMVLGAVVAPSLALRDRPAELEVYGQMPAFRLVDHTGGSVTDQHLRGRVVVANFIFTRCKTVCPVFTMKMRRVQDRTGDVAEALKLISFSVDPEHDTPQVLAEYAATHHADADRWRFITGSFDDVRRVVTDGLAMAMEEMSAQDSGAPDIVHAEHFVLLDRAGRIRGYYHSNDATRVEQMLRDARRLIRARP